MTNADAAELTDVTQDVALSPAATPARKSGASGPMAMLLQRFGLLLALLAAIVIFGALRPSSFATTQNLASILTGSAALTLISLGIMMPLIVQQFDLSVGYTATIASLLTVGVLSRNNWPVWQAIALGLLVSLVIGFRRAHISRGRLTAEFVTGRQETSLQNRCPARLNGHFILQKYVQRIAACRALLVANT